VRIIIFHIHGGEAKIGGFDEALRHSITKMAYRHYVTTKKYADRVIQLGENPKRVFNVGGMGVDAINRLKLLHKKEVEKKLSFQFNKFNLIVTYHSVTLDNKSSEVFLKELLNALEDLKETNIIFTLTNADTDGRVINKMIKEFVKYNDNSFYYHSLGQLLYFSTLQFVDAVVGNSSSGLLEAPSFRIGTINIGDRQHGRVSADSVIHCNPKKEHIAKSLKKLYSDKFQEKLKKTKNPYGDGNSTEKIIKVLKFKKLPTSIKKKFFDINFES
jgi:GDP/UDP-N,N'-diacetylbacillosamine 2-epimerase (hydrolysing)